MGFFRRLFGKGKIRVDGVTTNGQTFTARMPYEGDRTTLDSVEVREKVKREMFYQHGLRVKTMTITVITED